MKPILSYRFLLALALVLPASCNREESQEEPQCHVDISITSGLLSEGRTLRPAVITVSVQADYPTELLRVLLEDASGDYSDEREMEEDGAVRFVVGGEHLLGSGKHQFTVRVLNVSDGTLLYQNRKVYVESEEVGAFIHHRQDVDRISIVSKTVRHET